MRKLYVVLSTLLFAAACEHGIILDIEVTVPADIATDYSTDAPGRLLLDGEIPGTSFHQYDFGYVCGESMEDLTASVRHDRFGCANRGTLRAWISPVPMGEAPVTCRLYEGKKIVIDQIPYEMDAPQMEVTVFADKPDSGCRNGEEAVSLTIER